MRFLLILLAVFSSSAFAEDYYWSGAGVGHFSTPALACQALAQKYIDSSTGVYINHKVDSLTFQTVEKYKCVLGATKASDGSYVSPLQTLYVYRYGTSCPVDTEYNPTTGVCDGDPCKPKEGQEQRVSKSGFKNDSFLACFVVERLGGKTYCQPKSTACFDGCAVDTAGDLLCTYDIAGQYHCAGTGTFNGTSCSSEVPSSDPDPDGNDPVPQEKSSDEPCIYGTVNGVTSCEQRKRLDSEGVFSQREGEGECTEEGCSGTDAKSKEDKTKTEITSSTDADGVTTTTKTDTKTQTKCTGTDTNCTTSTTTKTTTTKTDGAGNTTSTTGTCSGPQCESNTNPDADGDGFGDCVGDDCGEGEEVSSVSGESCDVELSCEGDAIQCAILRQEKENNCKWRLGAEEEAAITASVSGEGFELEEKNLDGAALFNEAISQGRWLAASCPAPRSISVMGKTISFSWEPVCEFAIAMGPLIVALASLFFAVFVFRGVKGS